MKVKVLAENKFRIVAVCDGGTCPAEDFITQGEATTKSSRDGLLEMIGHVAERGLQNIPAAWWHEAEKARGIYELRKGQLRLFFFKGSGKDIAVCTSGVLKKSQKADRPSVNKTASWRAGYLDAIANKTLEVVDDETE